MTIMVNIDLIKSKVKELVRHAALARIEDHSRLEGFDLQELEGLYKPGQVMGNWMSIILVTGDALRITVKLHFSLQDARALSCTVYGAESPESVGEGKAVDFVKELCNLTVGYIVKEFDAMSIAMGISLPLCTRGFYEVFADYVPTEQPLIRFSDIWRLEHEGHAVNATVMYEISNPEVLQVLESYEVDEGDSEDDSEFDFL